MMTKLALRAVGLIFCGLAASAAFAADIPRPEHPTPQSVRPHWANLNGPWEFRFDPEDQGIKGEWFKPDAKGFDQTITVPFPWESELSGIHRPKDAPKVAWYRRTFTVPEDFPKENTVRLHFGAVDYEATVWVDGYQLGKHEGGYTPFSFDLRPVLQKQNPGTHTVVVRAFDPTDPQLPVGKQVGWYTTTSGIWQTVWIEAVPSKFIGDFTITTAIDPAKATITVLATPSVNDGKYTISARSDDPTLMEVSTPLVALDVRANSESKVISRSSATLELPVRDPKLWSPDSPHLYNITLELKDDQGKVVDSVQTYFGLRTIARGKVGNEPFERVLLNGKPIYLRGALDQSFNPKGIYTAPTDEFLKRDIELAKEAGTNFLRIHIKPDEPRRLYWADKLGMLIMEDMPNNWNHSERSEKAWESTLHGIIARDKNHPSIFAWVDFNETWGVAVPDPAGYKKSPQVQAWVGKMVELTRKPRPDPAGRRHVPVQLRPHHRHRPQ